MIHTCPHCNHKSHHAGEISNPFCPHPKCQRFKNDPVLQEGQMEMYVRRDLDPEYLATIPFKQNFLQAYLLTPGRKVRVKLEAVIWSDEIDKQHLRLYERLPIKEARELLEFPEEANKQLAEWHVGIDLGSENGDHGAVHVIQVKTPTDRPNKNGDDFSRAKLGKPFMGLTLADMDRKQLEANFPEVTFAVQKDLRAENKNLREESLRWQCIMEHAQHVQEMAEIEVLRLGNSIGKIHGFNEE